MGQPQQPPSPPPAPLPRQNSVLDCPWIFLSKMFFFGYVFFMFFFNFFFVVVSLLFHMSHAIQKGIMEGQRNLITVDNDCALEVSHLKEGTRSFEVQRPKFEEGCAEVSIREGPEELTLRAEEVGSQKACINVDHIAKDRWRPPLVDADWHAFCQAIFKGTQGSDWGVLCDYYEEMSRAVGVKKPMKAKKREPCGK